MATWLDITDAQLTQYRPVLARWVKGVRDNLVAVAQRPVDTYGPLGALLYQITGGSYGAASDLTRFYVPEYLVGSGGTTLSMVGSITVDPGDEIKFRLEAGGQTGTEVTANGGVSTTIRTVFPSVTWTPTPNDYATIQANGYIATGASAYNFRLGNSTTAAFSFGIVQVQRVDS